MNKITKIVLTGGPCAGKTTALSFLRESLINNGYGAVVVPETSTELFSSGISPSKMTSLADFHQSQLEVQFAKEDIFQNACEKFKNFDHIVLICDRGQIDAKVYLGDKAFATLLKNNNLTEKQVLARYDAVFKLVSAANGAEEYYTLENNAVRKETAAEAVELDNKITEVWKSHPYFRIIDNSTDFEHKMYRLLDSVLMFLKGKQLESGEPGSYERT